MRRFLAACSLLFLLPSIVRAAGPTFISEIAWAGSSASIADEWFELCGPPGSDISGWTIEGASIAPIALPAGSVIPASGAFLIANYGSEDPKSTLAAAADLVTTSVALSNASLFIVLRDAEGTAADVAGASGTAPYAGTSGTIKSSMERIDPALDGGVPDAWKTAVAAAGFDAGAPELGTPGTCGAPAGGEEEPAPAPATSTAETPPAPAPEPPAVHAEPMSPIRISEIYPSPLSGEKEWLELVNPSGVGEFLDDWTVEDANGTKTPLSGLLMPWARAVIEAPKGSLNNDGDVVILRDRFGRAVHRVEYPKTAKGEAYMRLELQESFAMTRTPTPGAANVMTQDAAETEPIPEAPAPAASLAPTPAALSSRPERSEADGSIRPETDPSASLGMTIPSGPKPAAPKPAVKPAAAKPKTPVSRYKGEAYVATVVVPPGVYAKTRAYIQRDGGIEELRLSASVAGAWGVGDRISFVAQTKSEGAVSFLLANPNSVRTIGSASATFASAEAWPREAGGYRFTAEVASIRGDALEVTLGGVEGDVLAPSGTLSALKPGDTVRVEGFIAPGPRPHVVLPYAHALRLEMAHIADAPAPPSGDARLPAAAAAGLTAFIAGAGLLAYLRMQRLKRLALTQVPIDPPSPGGFGGAGDDAWE